MALGLPIALLVGTVRRVSREQVPPRTTAEGTALPSYWLSTLVLDTGLSGADDDGGVADVTWREDKHGTCGVGIGEVVTVKVRPYVGWSGPEGRKRASVRYAYAGPVEAPAPRRAAQNA